MLRLRKQWTQEQMALALGIPVERYTKYERRTPLPHDLIPQFCLIVGCGTDELFRPSVIVTIMPAKRRPSAA